MMANGNRALAPIVLLMAALLLSIPAAGSGTLGADVTITQAVQSTDTGVLDDVTHVLNWLGNTAPSVALGGLAVLLLACFRRTVEASVVFAGVAARILNPMLKDLFESPRPDGGAVEIAGAFTGLGFPSGHSSGALLLFGSLIYVIGRLGPFPGYRALQALAVALIAGIGFSRIYVGAHWPSDVLGGFLWSAAFLLAAIIVVERLWVPRRERESAPDAEGLVISTN